MQIEYRATMLVPSSFPLCSSWRRRVLSWMEKTSDQNWKRFEWFRVRLVFWFWLWLIDDWQW